MPKVGAADFIFSPCSLNNQPRPSLALPLSLLDSLIVDSLQQLLKANSTGFLRFLGRLEFLPAGRN